MVQLFTINTQRSPNNIIYIIFYVALSDSGVYVPECGSCRVSNQTKQWPRTSLQMSALPHELEYAKKRSLCARNGGLASEIRRKERVVSTSLTYSI